MQEQEGQGTTTRALGWPSRMSLTMREPSAILSCSEVVGWDSSTPCHSPSEAADDEAAAASAAAVAAATLVEGPASVRPVPWKAVCFGSSGSL